jgi:hypothetical protein
MGLSAVVYRNVSELEKQFGAGLFEVDETTGEAILKPGKNIAVPKSSFIAIQRRIGNVSEVGHLRAIVAQFLPEQVSVFEKQILYSGSHSGDSIEPNDYSRLQEEISLLKSRGLTELAGLIETMESLLIAAKAERNPIVFVRRGEAAWRMVEKLGRRLESDRGWLRVARTEGFQPKVPARSRDFVGRPRCRRAGRPD